MSLTGCCAIEQGWRLIFIGMAGMALFATVAVFLCGIEPRSLKPLQAARSPECSSVLQAPQKDSQSNFLSTWRVLQIPSFQIVLAAGIVGAARASCLRAFHGASSLRCITQASLHHLGRGGQVSKLFHGWCMTGKGTTGHDRMPGPILDASLCLG